MGICNADEKGQILPMIQPSELLELPWNKAR